MPIVYDKQLEMSDKAGRAIATRDGRIFCAWEMSARRFFMKTCFAIMILLSCSAPTFADDFPSDYEIIEWINSANHCANKAYDVFAITSGEDRKSVYFSHQTDEGFTISFASFVKTENGWLGICGDGLSGRNYMRFPNKKRPSWRVGDADFLTGNEIRDLIYGNTIVGLSQSHGHYDIFYTTGGEARAENGNGNWSIQRDELCVNWGQGQDCWSAAQRDGNILWIEGGNVIAVGRPVSGNINDF